MIKLLKIDGNRGYFFPIPEEVKKVVIGKEGDELRLKWTNLETLSKKYAELAQGASGKWEIEILNSTKEIMVRGDMLQRSTVIALANMGDLKNSGDLVEIVGEITFKLVEEIEETGLTTSQEPVQ